MIKVGQIYEDVDNFRFVITLYSPVDMYIIYNNGGSCNLIRKNFNSLNYKFIKEYPTWQEAVNSKEFNNDDR